MLLICCSCPPSLMKGTSSESPQKDQLKQTRYPSQNHIDYVFSTSKKMKECCFQIHHLPQHLQMQYLAFSTGCGIHCDSLLVWPGTWLETEKNGEIFQFDMLFCCWFVSLSAFALELNCGPVVIWIEFAWFLTTSKYYKYIISQIFIATNSNSKLSHWLSDSKSQQQKSRNKITWTFPSIMNSVYLFESTKSLLLFCEKLKL